MGKVELDARYWQTLLGLFTRKYQNEEQILINFGFYISFYLEQIQKQRQQSAENEGFKAADPNREELGQSVEVNELEIQQVNYQESLRQRRSTLGIENQKFFPLLQQLFYSKNYLVNIPGIRILDFLVREEGLLEEDNKVVMDLAKQIFPNFCWYFENEEASLREESTELIALIFRKTRDPELQQYIIDNLLQKVIYSGNRDTPQIKEVCLSFMELCSEHVTQ